MRVCVQEAAEAAVAALLGAAVAHAAGDLQEAEWHATLTKVGACTGLRADPAHLDWG